MHKEDFFSELSFLILKYIDYYKKSILSHIIRKKEFQTEPHKFFYTIMFKTCSTFEASNILIRNYHSHPHYQSSLSILFRSIMADIIIAEYVIKKGTDNNKEDIIKSIYFDHISNIISACEKIYPIVYKWSKKRVESEIAQIKKNNPEFFNNQIKPLKASPSKLVKTIFAESKKGDYKLELLKSSYNLYDEYSKFEHLGELSFKLIHRGFKKDESEKLILRLIESIRIITSVLNNYTNLWETINPEYKIKLKKLTKDLFSFIVDNYDDLE